MAADAPLVLVSVGPVVPDDSSAKYKEGDTQAIWADYTIVNRYEKDRHVYMMGVTNTEGYQTDTGKATVAFVQMASGTLLWICDWTAARAKEMPPVPNPTPVDPNWILLDDHFELHNPGLAKDGVNPVYRISGTYVYGHINPNKETILSTNFPRAPWMEDFMTRTLTTAVFENGISDAGYSLSTP